MNNRHEIQVNGYEIEEAQEINLREYWERLRRRKGTVIAVTVAVLALGAFWTFIQKPKYTARATLLIEKEPNILSFEQVLQIETLRDDFYQTQYRLLEGRALAEDVIRRLELYKNREFIGDPAKRKSPADPGDHVFMENMVDAFLGRLAVRPVRMTRLVQVNFEAGDPKLAANCVNTLADAFIDQNIEMKFEATEQATKFISDQIASLQTEIETKERRLQEYESKANIVALSDNETTIIEKLGEINRALTAAQIDRLRKEAIYNELRNMGPDYIPEAINNPLIQRLREEYVRLKRDVARLEELFQPEYPELQRRKVELESARSQLAEETQNLVRSANSDFQTALNNERNLEKAFNEQRDAAFQLNSDAILYSGLKIEIANSKELLDSLMRRESETGVSARLKGLRTSNIRVVDRARPPVSASSPNKRRNLILALLLGLGGGVGLAFLFDFLDNSVKTSEDVEKYSGLPTLGIVPSFRLDAGVRGRLLGGRGKALSRGVAGHLTEGKRRPDRSGEAETAADAEAEAKARALLDEREIKALRRQQRIREKEEREKEKGRERRAKKARSGRFVTLDIGSAGRAADESASGIGDGDGKGTPATGPEAWNEAEGGVRADAAGAPGRDAPSYPVDEAVEDGTAAWPAVEGYDEGAVAAAGSEHEAGKGAGDGEAGRDGPAGAEVDPWIAAAERVKKGAYKYDDAYDDEGDRVRAVVDGDRREARPMGPRPGTGKGSEAGPKAAVKAATKTGASSRDRDPDALAPIHVPVEVDEPRSIELIPYYFPNSRLAEAYRSIRTSLLLSSADKPVKTVAITSPLPGEGKTVSVANLGVTLAQSDKTVVIVDADLRKPRQHRIFRVKNVYGLTSYLTERVDIRKVIKTTPLHNLYLVNSGPIPPNPAELLGSERMTKFIRMLSEECDFILFDLPPMLEISDALILGAKIDGIVLVVQGDKTSKEALKKARERLDLLKVRTLGVIINDVDVQKHSYYYGQYYYGGYQGYHHR